MTKLDTSYPLDASAQADLQQKQALIDAVPDYSDRVDLANNYWTNRKNNAAFNGTDGVKAVLMAMCHGLQRCCYCEDSLGDEIEHIFPKALFPEKTFVWENYLFACGGCNSPKSSKYAIFDSSGTFHQLVAPKDKTLRAQPPTPYISAVINPREDNPMDFWELDLTDFTFRITVTAGSSNYQKANYTLNELLYLNNRENLVQGRATAYIHFKNLVYTYSNTSTIDPIRGGKIIRKSPFFHVWLEIVRQFNDGKLKHVDNDLYTWLLEQKAKKPFDLLAIS